MTTEKPLSERFQYILSEWFEEPPVNFEKVAERLVSVVPYGTEWEILRRENKALESQRDQLKEQNKRLDELTHVLDKAVKLAEERAEVAEERLEAEREGFLKREDALENRVKSTEADAEELRKIKGYMGVGYPIFRSALEKCIEEKVPEVE